MLRVIAKLLLLTRFCKRFTSFLIQRPCPKGYFYRSVSKSIKMITMDSPSAQRNKFPIWEVLSTEILPMLPSKELSILEIACGCGVHTIFFSSKMIESGKIVRWFPTDPDEVSRLSVLAQRDEKSVNPIIRNSISPPVSITLDSSGFVETGNVPRESFNLIICINMIHISNWNATIGLLKLASEKLTPDGILYCYGPFKMNGTSVESNLKFDQSLKNNNPLWGVRNLEDVVSLAQENGLMLEKTVEMPANNLSLIFRRKP